MSKKLTVAFICFSIVSTQASFACAEKHKHHGYNKTSPIMNEDVAADRPVIQPDSELAGHVCLPYKYTSEVNKSQVLGVLKNKIPIRSTTSDVNPSESLVGEMDEPIKAAPVKKVKKTKIKKIKAEPTQPKKELEQTTSPITQQPMVTTAPTGMVNDAYEEQKSVPAPTAPGINVEPQTIPPVTKDTTNDSKATSELNLENKTPQPDAPAIAGRIVSLDFAEAETELSDAQKTTLNHLIEDLQSQPNSMIKIHSLGYVNQGNVIESRRTALQRSIKIRKYLIEKGVNPNDITVNVSDDITHKTNKVELTIASR